MIKPQDIVFLLKLVSRNLRRLNASLAFNKPGNPPWDFASLAKELHMSSSEAHASFKRAVKCSLMNKHTREPIIRALAEFLEHGLRYTFPAERGEQTRGIPTAAASPAMQSLLAASNESPPVWPWPTGETKGFGFSPLYRSVPEASLEDPVLYDLLALTDSIRGGNARERSVAVNELKRRFEALPNE